MVSVSVDVLSLILQRLPLQQKYQLLTISHKFEEASSLALKEHESLYLSEYCWLGPTDEGPCFIGNHRTRVEDLIEKKWFDSDDIRRNILSRLRGLKVLRIKWLTKENMKDLQIFCPKIECLSSCCKEGSILPRLDYLVHFCGCLTGSAFNQLDTCFPCVTDLWISVFPSEVELMSSSLREGIQSLSLDASFMRTVFLSPAMKTVTKMKLDRVNTADIYFKARRLQELELMRPSFKSNDMETFCSNLSKSLSHTPGLQSFIWGSYVTMTIWKLPPSLFYLMNKLKTVVLSIPIRNLSEVVEVICSVNPNLETVEIRALYEPKKILDIISTLTRLQSLIIYNQSSVGLTRQELDEFVNNNRVNGRLRFHFTLIQTAYFPAELEVKSVDWNGITWKRFFLCTYSSLFFGPMTG